MSDRDTDRPPPDPDGEAAPVEEAQPKARAGPIQRRMLRPVLLGVVPLVAGLFGLYVYAVSGRYVSTENAYVKADIVAIAPQIDGRVIEVPVEENEHIEKGEVLFRIDPAPFRIALDQAEAELLAVRNEIEALRAEYRQIQAEIEEAKERTTYFEAQAARQRELRERRIAAQARLDEAEMELAAARQRVSALREKLRSVLARLGGDPGNAVERHPDYREAEAAREMAALELAYTTVRAPVSGIISRMRLEPGEWVEKGEPAFTIVDPATIWIEANLKETQLEHVRVGQKVEVRVDAYPGHVWPGRIASISAATGAEFAVIPPQNATGNWVKVVQRVPVRIAVEQRPELPPLRAGMTVAIAVDTEREPGLARIIQGAVAHVRGDE